MNDSQLLRYSRHILLPEIGIAGQETLLRSHVLIVGAGGLGSPASLYLAASGIGNLTLCDGDEVDLTNLQRQIVHHTDAIGLPKTLSARQTLTRINPEIAITPIDQYADREKLSELVATADLVIDASDRFSTRDALNHACVRHRKPLVSGAVIGFGGQITVFDLRHDASPCYHCLFPEDSESEDIRCATMGVFAPLAGIIGCMQAAEAIKVLLGVGETLCGRVLLLDGMTMAWRSVRLQKDSACTVCGSGADD